MLKEGVFYSPSPKNLRYRHKQTQIAETIKEQLFAGREKVRNSAMTIIWSWGARAWTAIENGLMFRVSGLKFKGIVRITLNGLDLYDVEFLKVKINKVTKTKSFLLVHEINNVYNDMLTDVVDNYVEKIPTYVN